MIERVVLQGGAPWGFRVERGEDQLIRIARLNANGKAHAAHVQIDDVIRSVNGHLTAGLSACDVMKMVHESDQRIELELVRQQIVCNTITNGCENSGPSSSSSSGVYCSAGTESLEQDSLPLHSKVSDVLRSSGDELNFSPASSNGQPTLKPYASSVIRQQHLNEQLSTGVNGPGSRALPWTSSSTKSNNLLPSKLPVLQNPTITLLQKSRASSFGNLCKGSVTSFEPPHTKTKPSGTESSGCEAYTGKKKEWPTPFSQSAQDSIVSRVSVDHNELNKQSSENEALRTETSDKRREALATLEKEIASKISHPCNSAQPSVAVEKELTSNPGNPYHPCNSSKPPNNSVIMRTKRCDQMTENHRRSLPPILNRSEMPVQNGPATQVPEKRLLIVEGIGPTDAKTGIPIAPRNNVDESCQKDWYKCMFRSLHKLEQNEGSRSFVFAGEDPDPRMAVCRRKSFSGTLNATQGCAADEEDKEGNVFDFRPMHRRNISCGNAKLASRSMPGSPTGNGPGNGRYLGGRLAPRSTPGSPTGNGPCLGGRLATRSTPGSPTGNGPCLGGRLAPRSTPGSPTGYRSYAGTRLSSRSTPGSPVGRNKPWQPADVRYEPEIYRHQPNSIATYAPGHSSLTQHELSKHPYLNSRDEFEDDDMLNRSDRWHRNSVVLNPAPSVSNQARPVQSSGGTGMLHYAADVQLSALRSMPDLRSAPEDNVAVQNNYPLQIMPPPSAQLQRKPIGNEIRGRATALYPFHAQSSKELSFERGDTIYLLRQMDRNWFEGECRGAVGIFPANYVEINLSLEDAQSAVQHEGLAKTKFSFVANSALQLSFQKDMFVGLVRRIDANWFEGRIGSTHGIIPVSYLDVIKEPSDKPSPGYIPAANNGSTNNVPHHIIGGEPQQGGQPYVHTQPPIGSFYQQNSGNYPGFGTQARQVSSIPPNSFGTHNNPVSMHNSWAPQNHQSSGVVNSRLGGLVGTNKAGVDYRPMQSGIGSRPPYNDSSVANQSVARQSHVQPSSRLFNGNAERSDKVGSIKYDQNQNIPAMSVPQENGSGMSVETARKFNPSRYIILYNYIPLHPDELELQRGDVIFVSDICDDGWYWGTSERTKQFGTFPGNYAQQI